MSKKQYSQSSNSGRSVQYNHHRKKALNLISQLTKTQKSKKNQQSEYKVKTLNEINKQIQSCLKRNPLSGQIFATDQLIVYIRYYFIQNISRCPCLNFFRLIMVTQEITIKYLKHNIPIYIARLIQKQQPKAKHINHEDQIYQALRFMSEWVNKFPSTFPKLLLSTLISFAQLPVVQGFQQRKKDHISINLKLLAFDILIDISNKSTKMVAYSGGFSLLSSAIIDPILNQKSQSIMYRFIYFLNQKKTRDYIKNYISIKKIFSIFTDLDNTFVQDSSKSKGNMQNSTKFQKQLQLAKRSIMSLIKSWTGIIYLGNQSSTLKSFLQALKQIPKKQDSQVRKVIFSIIQQILSIGDNLITNDNYLIPQNQFRVSYLVNSYVVSLIQLLLQNDLFKILIELSGVQQNDIAEPAQILLKKLSIYIFNFLPDSGKYIDFLITAATKNDATSLILKSSSSFIMSKIGNYIYQKSNKIKNQYLNQLQTLFNLNSIYIALGRSNISQISITLNKLTCKQKQNQRRNLINLNPIPKQYKQNYKQWNWNIIQQLFVFPQRQKQLNFKLDTHQKHKQNKILKYLLRFYSHTRGSFSQLKWTNQNFQYIKVGKLFIRNAITIPQYLPLVKNPPQSQFECTVSFMGQLQKLLQTALIGFTQVNNNFYLPFFKLMQRQLILWIGIFSQNKVGYQLLLCQNNFFQLLYEFIQNPQCSLLIFGVMLYFDFYRDNINKRIASSFDNTQSKSNQKSPSKSNEKPSYITIGPKALLKKCIRQGSKNIKILSLQIIKLLFKAQLPHFPREGMKMLIQLLYLQDIQIKNDTLQTIEYLLSQKSHISTFLSILIQQQAKQQGKFKILQPKLEQSKQIFIRLISIQIGYKFICQKIPGWLQRKYQNWLKIQHDHNYCLNLQNLLSQTLNFVPRKQNQYKIQNCKTIYQLGFLFKLPWIIYMNDLQIPAYMKMTKNKFMLYYNFNNHRNYQQFIDYREKTIRVSLAIGSQYVNQNIKNVKQKYINQISLVNLKQTILNGQQYMYVSQGGVTIYLQQTSQQMHIQQQGSYQTHIMVSYYIKRIQIDIKIYFNQQNQQLPLHLIQQLTKTQSGLKFLTDKQFLKHSQLILNSSHATSLQMRSNLWSLGYYGSTKLGMAQLINHNIVDKIIHHSFNNDALSLRGTCRYVLNMLCHSQTGRNYMITKGFIVNKKTLNCFPKNYKMFYQISKNQLPHFSLNYKYWQLYQNTLKPMSQNENKLFLLMSQLINALSFKQSITSIKQIMKNSGRIIHSVNLLQNVINLLTFYKFRYQARKNIYMIFQQFFRSPQFNNSHQQKIIYVTSKDIQQLPLQEQNINQNL